MESVVGGTSAFISTFTEKVEKVSNILVYVYITAMYHYQTCKLTEEIYQTKSSVITFTGSKGTVWPENTKKCAYEHFLSSRTFIFS